MKIFECDYNKPHRCPGWSGSGWIVNTKRSTCDGETPEGVRRWRWHPEESGYGPLWNWRIRRTNCCDAVVLPHVLRWLNWRTYRWVLWLARSNFNYWRQERQYR